VWRRGDHPFAYSSRNRFRASIWIAPSGYYSRYWRDGDFLPFDWYGPRYRLADWWSYDLPWPPPGYDWVRIGDDALLIDRYSGRIVQVVRNLFW
jgi:Ni/Co efflux regulator RcnB